jgi:hypothetical protein
LFFLRLLDLRVAVLVLGVCTSPVHATEVFVTVGEFGEASFSDEASEGASVIEFVTPPQRDPEAVLAAAASLERTWVLAREMEASRLARETAAAERRSRQAAYAGQKPSYVEPEPQVVVGYGGRYRPHKPHNRPHHRLGDRPQDRPNHFPARPRDSQRGHEGATAQPTTVRKPLSWPDGR